MRNKINQSTGRSVISRPFRWPEITNGAYSFRGFYSRIKEKEKRGKEKRKKEETKEMAMFRRSVFARAFRPCSHVIAATGPSLNCIIYINNDTAN